MDVVKERKALRILVIVYRQSPLFASSDINAIRQQAVARLDASEADTRTLVLETWPRRTILVFDMWNEKYDFAQAHHPEDLPVLAIHMHTKEKIKIGMVSEPKRSEINGEVAHRHRLHGYGALPIVEDHRNGNVPTYMNPRDMKYAAG